jgi:hypothetical protein
MVARSGAIDAPFPKLRGDVLSLAGRLGVLSAEGKKP